MVVLLAYTPGLDRIFHMSALGQWHWVFLLAWPPLVLGAEEARKAIARARAGEGEPPEKGQVDERNKKRRDRRRR